MGILFTEGKPGDEGGYKSYIEEKEVPEFKDGAAILRKYSKLPDVVGTT